MSYRSYLYRLSSMNLNQLKRAHILVKWFVTWFKFPKQFILKLIEFDWTDSALPAKGLDMRLLGRHVTFITSLHILWAVKPHSRHLYPWRKGPQSCHLKGNMMIKLIKVDAVSDVITNPLQWAQVHGRNEFVSWKSCLDGLSTSTMLLMSVGGGCWASSSTAAQDGTGLLLDGGERWISLSSSCLGWPKTASTISFIRSSSVFFRSAVLPTAFSPSVSWSLPVEFNRIGWLSVVKGSGNEIVCGEDKEADRGVSFYRCTIQSNVGLILIKS